MDGKKLNELRELVEFLKANGIAQFEMEQDDLKIALSFAGAAAPASGGVDLASLAALMSARGAAAPVAAAPVAAAPAASAPPAAALAVEVDPHAGAHVVKSPIVGTFYPAPSPDAENFVKIGDRVEVGKVLCIVEAMKLMNEIESDGAGEIVAVLAKPGQPVEYGQPLFAIKVGATIEIEIMKTISPESRERYKTGRFARWCGLFTLAVLAWLYVHALGWHFWFPATAFVVGLVLEVFRWFRMRQMPLDMTATQG